VSATVLVIGAGGIAAPFGLALAHAFATTSTAFDLLVVDDDVVERSNLHRQILFGEPDVGKPKLEAFAAALSQIAPDLSVALQPGRLRPEGAETLMSRAAVVVDATDNFASRFLAADAAHLMRRPIVHAAAVRWHATVLATSGEGRPCYRCLFEDLPEGDAPDCATAGVLGPVCGVAGAIAAELTLRILAGDASAFGAVFTFDGKRDRLRRVPIVARASCALCGTSPAIRDIRPARYVGPVCE